MEIADPKVEIQGSKTLFTFRIPKLNTMIVIDPVVGEGGEGGDGGDGGSASAMSFNFFAFTLLLGVAAMFTM